MQNEKVILWIYFSSGDDENGIEKLILDKDDYDEFFDYLLDDQAKGFYYFDDQRVIINCAQISHIQKGTKYE